MPGSDRTDADLTQEPIPFRDTDERMIGYGLGCLEGGCGLLAGAGLVVVALFIALLLA